MRALLGHSPWQRTTIMPEKAPIDRAKLKKSPILFPQTQAVIQRISNRLKAPFLSYWISVNGSVCHNDVVAMNEILYGVSKTKRLYLFVKSDGGSGQASLRLVNLLRRKCDRLIALVPLNCESAATMLALGADEIHMGPMAYLTAVDTSITHDMSPVDKDNDRVRVGTNELQRILALWNAEKGSKDKNPYEEIYRYIHPLVIGAVNRAGSLSTMLCKQILSYHIKSKALSERIAHRLNNDYPSHSYPIVLREAKQIGLNAKELDPDLGHSLMELNELYSEMGQMCRTDFDEFNHHDNEIVNILEAKGLQIRYQIDKDWHFRQSDRTWVSTNEASRWRINRMVEGSPVEEILHIR
jgi:hypothetical protein